MTENGWPPNTDAAPFVSIPLSACVQVTIPGTTEVLWFQKGAPAILLPAFLADLNAYIESSSNSAGYGDEGSWTNGNSVGTSNHLGATAFDFNWSDHPMGPAPEDPAAGWQGSEIIDGDEVPAVQALLDWYEGTIYWGGNWDSPKDTMHFQMGYDTYDPSQGQAGTAAVQDFIKRKIRADGFSTYKRGTAQTPDNTATQASVLAAATGMTLALATKVLPSISQGLIDSECTTVNRIAMWLAQEGTESAGFTATVEIGDIDGTTYQGRTWEQITGLANYTAFSKWCYGKGLVPTPTYFVDNPAALGDEKWEALGASWYWTVARPQINGMADAGDVLGVTKAINGGTNGLADRTRRWNLALAQGTALLTLITPASDAPDTGALIDVANIPQTEWDDMRDAVTWMREQMDISRPEWDEDADLGTDSQGRPNNLRTAVAGTRRNVSGMVAVVAALSAVTNAATPPAKGAAPK